MKILNIAGITILAALIIYFIAIIILPSNVFVERPIIVDASPLHRAAAYEDSDTIELLLKHGADKEKRDANGDTPLAWASKHLRPATILSLLCYGEHKIGGNSVSSMTSDHGSGWGNGMENKFIGRYLRERTELK